MGSQHHIRASETKSSGKLCGVQTSAYHSLGFDTDLRDFTIAVKALEHLNIKSIELLSNNPDKIKVWEHSGIIVAKRIPLIIKTNAHNLGYLGVKKEQLNHLL